MKDKHGKELTKKEIMDKAGNRVYSILLDFQLMLHEASIDAKVKLQIFHWGLQGKDHPSLLSFPEGNYLKTVFAQKCASK